MTVVLQNKSKYDKGTAEQDQVCQLYCITRASMAIELQNKSKYDKCSITNWLDHKCTQNQMCD